MWFDNLLTKVCGFLVIIKQVHGWGMGDIVELCCGICAFGTKIDARKTIDKTCQCGPKYG